MRWASFARRLALAAGLAAGVASTAGGLAACKGKRAPSVTAADWAQVEAGAAPAIASGPPDELVRALALVEGAQLPSDLQPDDPEEAARLAGELPEAAFDAVEALVRWDQAGGRLPPRTCKPTSGSLHTIKLARLALLVAGDNPEAPPVRAVAGLAARHRGEGVSLLEGMVGTAIADALRRWSTDHGQPAGEAARRYQPTEDGLRRIIAAEALCSRSLLDEVRGSAGGDTGGKPGGTIAELDAVVTSAERAHIVATDGPLLLRYWVDLLADLRARPSDPAAIDRKIEARADTLARDTIRHPILAMVAPPSARMLTRLRESDDAYRAWLAGAPPPSPAP